MGSKEEPRKNRTPVGIQGGRAAAATREGMLDIWRRAEDDVVVASGSKRRVVMAPEGTARGFPVGTCCTVKMRRSSRPISTAADGSR